MRITQQQLRRIIQEEVTKMVKETRGGGRHGTDWGYGSFGGGGHGGSDEGWGDEGGDDWGAGPSARDMGWSVGDQVRSGGKMGTVTKVSEWDNTLNIEWEDGKKSVLDAKYAKRA